MLDTSGDIQLESFKRLETHMQGLAHENDLDLVDSVTALVRFCRDNLDVVIGKTPLALTDIDRASIIAGRLLSGVSTAWAW